MSEARIRPEIWANQDFTGLSSGAQRLYMLLLSHPSRNWAGVLPLTLRRWAALAPDTTEETIRAAVNELVAHEFVVVDWDTEELLIRTFIRNDKVYLQSQLTKSWQEQARQIASPALRSALSDELLLLPDHRDVKSTRETAYSLVARLIGSLPGSLVAACPAGSGVGEGSYVSAEGSPSPSPSPTPTPSPAVTGNAAKSPPRPQGCRLPDGWRPDREVIDAMKAEFPTLSEAWFHREHAVFTDYWIAQPGQRGVKVDWNATWRNWIRRADKTPAASVGGRKLGAIDQGAMSYAQWSQDYIDNQEGHRDGQHALPSSDSPSHG